MSPITNARGASEQAIRAWKAEHPEGTQAECVAAGIASKSSVSRVFRKMNEEAKTPEDQPRKLAAPARQETPTIAHAADRKKEEADMVNIQETNAPLEAAPAAEEKRRRGPHRVTMANGLRPGQERATFIADSATMDLVRDIAYTRRMSMKDLMNEILTEYLSGIDASTIEHRPK